MQAFPTQVPPANHSIIYDEKAHNDKFDRHHHHPSGTHYEDPRVLAGRTKGAIFIENEAVGNTAGNERRADERRADGRDARDDERGREPEERYSRVDNSRGKHKAQYNGWN